MDFMVLISGMSTLEQVFFGSAVVGGALFMIRLVLQFAGAVDVDLDAGADVAVDASPDIGSSDISFKLLSLEGITAFLTMFGLIGLATSKTTNAGPAMAFIGGFAAGLAAMWLIGKVFQSMVGLQSVGTMDLKNAVGQQGTVYLTIDPKEGGKVEVSVQDRLQVFEAVIRSDEALETGTPVKVVEVRGATLVVEKAS